MTSRAPVLTGVPMQRHPVRAKQCNDVNNGTERSGGADGHSTWGSAAEL